MNSSHDRIVHGFEQGTVVVYARTRFSLMGISTLIGLVVGLGCMENWIKESGALSIHAGEVRYIYDAGGRLSAVVDPLGDTAIYTYDEVGNVVDVTRQSSALVGILGFTPANGAAGQTVTILGTAFSSTPLLNAVTFNGIPATVISATSNEIVTTVPVEASTGLIAVTSPNGSASSRNTFTVLSSSATPEIFTLTPFVGTAETAVTITGTNFVPPPGACKVFFNGYLAGGIIEPTSIITAVPSLATSGPIRVTTSKGTDVGPDFFIPPSPYVAGDVDSTGRISPGETKTMSVTTTNHIGLLVFTGNGTAGQRMSMTLTQGGLSMVAINHPDGNTVASGFTNAFGKVFIEPFSITSTGSYSILLDPNGMSVVPAAQVALYHAESDVTGAIDAGGPPVQVSTTSPGQNVQLTFNGTAGQRVSLQVTQGNLSKIVLQNPDGSQLASVNTTGFGNAFLEPQVLPTTGSYILVLDPVNEITVSNATLTLYDVPPDVVQPMAINGAGVPLSITTPGQNGVLTFAGSANLELTVSVAGNTMSNVAVRLRRADGTVLASQSSGASTFNLLPQTLPATETYSVLVDPFQTLTGMVTLTVTSSDGNAPLVSAITATSLTGESATVTWATDEPADSQVEFGNTTAYGSTTALDPNLVQAHSVGLRGLHETTLYHFRVFSRDASGNLTVSGDQTFMTGKADTEVPAAPPSLTAMAQLTGPAIDLHWSAATDNVGVTGYHLERCQGTGCSNFASVSMVTGLTFTDTGLAYNTNYSYRVRARDAAGNLSAWSPVGNAIIDTIPPTVPMAFSATAISAAQINLSWGISTDNVAVTLYEIWRCVGNGCTNFSPLATTTGLTFSNTGLTKGTWYTYQVRAGDAAGNWSNFTSSKALRTKNK